MWPDWFTSTAAWRTWHCTLHPAGGGMHRLQSGRTLLPTKGRRLVFVMISFSRIRRGGWISCSGFTRWKPRILLDLSCCMKHRSIIEYSFDFSSCVDHWPGLLLSLPIVKCPANIGSRPLYFPAARHWRAACEACQPVSMKPSVHLTSPRCSS